MRISESCCFGAKQYPAGVELTLELPAEIQVGGDGSQPLTWQDMGVNDFVETCIRKRVYSLAIGDKLEWDRGSRPFVSIL